MPDAAAGEYHSDTLHAAWATDIGNVRTTNEDAARAIPEQGLFIISDGMGGEYAGGYAAELVVGRLPLLVRDHLNRLPEKPTPEELFAALRDAVRELNHNVREESSQMAGARRMGATRAMVLVLADATCVANMGDTRIYRLAAGRLEALTMDHSIVGSLVREGVISAHEARYHPLRGQLTRFVGMGGEGTADVQTLQWNSGERLLLCTDGVTEVLYDDEIRQILLQHDELAAACRHLIEAAKHAGSGDNVTVMIVEKVGP